MTHRRFTYLATALVLGAPFILTPEALGAQVSASPVTNLTDANEHITDATEKDAADAALQPCSNSNEFWLEKHEDHIIRCI